MELRLALSRSRTCLRNNATTKPSTATGIVHMNTVCNASAYAAMIGAAARGQRVQALGLPPPAIVAGLAVPVWAAVATPSSAPGVSELA